MKGKGRKGLGVPDRAEENTERGQLWREAEMKRLQEWGGWNKEPDGKRQKKSYQGFRKFSYSPKVLNLAASAPTNWNLLSYPSSL